MPPFVRTAKCDGGKGGAVAAGMDIGPRDSMKLDEADWQCFANSRLDPDTAQWTLAKKLPIDPVPKSYGTAAH